MLTVAAVVPDFTSTNRAIQNEKEGWFIVAFSVLSGGQETFS